MFRTIDGFDFDKNIIQMNNNLNYVLSVRLEDDFDKSNTETDHKLRAKMVKEFNRKMKVFHELTDNIYTSQVAIRQTARNIRYIIECAINNVCYKELVKLFATIDFHSKLIVRECKKVNEYEVQRFLKENDLTLGADTFRMMLDTINSLNESLKEWIPNHKEYFIQYDVERDTYIDMDMIKEVFKNTQKELKIIQENKR